MAGLRQTVRGNKEARAGLLKTVRDLEGGEYASAMTESLMYVVGDARRNAPVDTGRLRNSITAEVRQQGRTIQGVVGSNVTYAAAMELGARPHWPPIAALETWARRHGTSAFLVARSIARRGVKARRYLQSALEKNAERIYRRLGAAVAKIISNNGGR